MRKCCGETHQRVGMPRPRFRCWPCEFRRTELRGRKPLVRSDGTAERVATMCSRWSRGAPAKARFGAAGENACETAAAAHRSGGSPVQEANLRAGADPYGVARLRCGALPPTPADGSVATGPASSRETVMLASTSWSSILRARTDRAWRRTRGLVLHWSTGLPRRFSARCRCPLREPQGQ